MIAASIERRLERAEQAAAPVETKVEWAPFAGPQTLAYESLADITGFGGSAGGGKTDLVAGLALMKHKRSLIVRREKAQTEGIVQRLSEILGSTDGLNSQKGIWQLPGGLLELAGLDNPGDERRWQGRAHDLKAFDEATELREDQVRFVMGWNRSSDASVKSRVIMTFNPPVTTEGRWVIPFFAPWLDKAHPLYPTPAGQLRYCAMLPASNGSAADCWFDSDGQGLDGRPFVLAGEDKRVTYDFDAATYTAEQIITPKSRTFIPARVTDNPVYVASGYISVLQSMPEPLRSAMLFGDFLAGMEDSEQQVIPTAWVEAAQERWTARAPRGEMLTVGVDVARGGKDFTTIARRHTGFWFDKTLEYPGRATPDGHTVAALALAAMRDEAPIFVDVIGVGASPVDILGGMRAHVIGTNVSERATERDRSGRLSFFNLRSQLWWKFRELLDPANDTGISLPPDKKLLQELCAPRWTVSGMSIKVESREDIVKRVGRSPDRATAYILAAQEMPKWRSFEDDNYDRDAVLKYDPYARMFGP